MANNSLGLLSLSFLITIIALSSTIMTVNAQVSSEEVTAGIAKEKQFSDFFKEMVDKSFENPDMVFYYFETSDSSHGRMFTDSNGNQVTESKDSGASYIARSCPSNKIAGSAISQAGDSGYVYTAIVQNGDFIAWEEGIDTASAVGQCEGSIGGCRIATATYGSELAPQVQMLREIRDNSLLQTQSGSVFMESFNQFYYSFSPAIADLERENPVFKEAVKLTITPLLSSLSILNYVDMDSEVEVLGYE